MPIRLFACDLDGTLADRHGHISAESLAAITRARDEGVLFVLATGRLPFVLHSYLDRLRVTDEPIIAGQGSLVVHRDGRILRRLPLAPSIARTAASIARPMGAGMAFFTDHDIVLDRFDFPEEQYHSWFGGHSRLDPAAIDGLDGQLIKFMAIHLDSQVVPGLLAELRAQLGDRAEITRSWDHFVEGTTPGADKGSALAWLCGQLGIGADEVVAIGDGGNDASMLKWAGHSAAPADGDPTAGAAAKWLAPPLPEHPVAATLAHFLGW